MHILKVRTDVAKKMFNMTLLFVVLILCPITYAEAGIEGTADGAILQPCESRCGCEEIYIYDAVTDRCLINFKKVMKRTVVVYENNNVQFLPDDEMAKSIYIEGEKLFKGIMMSVFLFMTCASVCVISACMYCFRINYTDRTLKHNVKAVAKKMNRNYCSKQMAPQRPPLPVVSESCSVLVEPAGVMVV